MPKPFPESSATTSSVTRRRESGVTLKQIAADFGISESTLTNWLTRPTSKTA